jgi:hypothetical protein
MQHFEPTSGRGWLTEPPGETRPVHEVEDAAIALLRTHGPREGEALERYQRLAEETDNEAHAYLMNLILEDERRHHRMIEEMLNAVQGFVWDVELEPSVPSAGRRADRRLYDETRRLLAFEREDAKELRALKKVLHQDKNWPLLELLVELMIHDTAKHIEILRFVQKLSKP